jgi:exodeoxyribonuclease V beta subunit
MPVPLFDPLSQPLLGLHSIEASAGTGKTYSITLLWLRLILEENLKVEEILVSTFTRAATAELQERLLASLRKAVAAASALRKGDAPRSGPEAQLVGRRLADSKETQPALLERLSRALSGFDLAPISTIHSFCQSLTSRHALELGCDPSLALAEDATDLVEQIISDAVLAHSDTQVSKVKDLRSIAKELVARPYGRLELDPTGVVSDLALKLRDELPTQKILARTRTFDDILVTVRAALDAQGPEGALAQAVRKRLKAAIIDECQDSDTLQISVFRALFDHPSTTSFIVIGDPKQSIYRFRGADLASYKELAGLAIAAPQMKVNHRSDSPLIEALNFLFGDQHVFPDDFDPEPVQPPPPEDTQRKTFYIPVTANHEGARISDPALTGAVVLHKSPETDRTPATRDIARWIARECKRLLVSGVTLVDRHSNQPRPIQPGDIAVISARASELRNVRRHVVAAGIPCQLAGKGLGSVYSSNEAVDVLSWLQILAALDGSGDILNKMSALLVSPLGGVAADELLALRENPLKLSEFCEAYRRISGVFMRSGPLPALLQHLGGAGVLVHNITHFEGERRLTNWRHLGSLLQYRFARGLRTAAALAEWLQTRIAAPGDADAEEGEESDLMKLETDESAVQFLTVHASKGLEFPVVFCPYLWHVGSLTIAKTRTKVAVIRDAGGWLLDARAEVPAGNKERCIEQQSREEYRKLYVALTRPRHRLYVGMADIPSSKGGHQNGSELSPLMLLEALRNGTQQYMGAGARPLPPGIVLFHGEGPAVPEACPGGLEQRAKNDFHLGDPPVPPRFAPPFFAVRAYSSLAKTSGEEVAHTPDHDAESKHPGGASSPGKASSDLLSELGPGGSQLGDRLHRALEEYLGNAREIGEVVSIFDKPLQWQRTLECIVATDLPLGETLLKLEAVRGRCITEMQFRMPTRGVSAETLSGALLADPLIYGNPERASWAASIGDWSFSEFHGFLQGFIDLLFEHEGRWYVADYKSNTLRNYGQVGLEKAMRDHHYLLQSRLYCLALHRHLQHHLPGYEHARHFGGVAYLFVRAFPEAGLWFERPDTSALDALSHLFQSERLPT